MVKGYEYAKGQYAMSMKKSCAVCLKDRAVDQIGQFVPLASVDPVCFDRA
jgi:non-homologous end joining protein Ku